MSRQFRMLAAALLCGIPFAPTAYAQTTHEPMKNETPKHESMNPAARGYAHRSVAKEKPAPGTAGFGSAFDRSTSETGVGPVGPVTRSHREKNLER